MRLTSIYIPENSLPHIFGEDHKGQIINLGGENFYSFSESPKKIKIKKEGKNKNYISKFYHNDIQLISAIVGQNGVGKSTILRALNHSIDPSSRKLVYIFESEKEEEIQIYNSTTKTIVCLDDKKFTTIDGKIFEPLYYSPSLDYDLIDARSPIALINYLTSDLETYFLDSISRNVSLLNDKIIETIKKVYQDFPDYDGITIKVKRQRKSFFRSVYIESNFGTPHRGDALKNEISGELSRLEDPSYGRDIYTRDEIKKMMEGNVKLLESESFTELFSKLWDIDDYKFVDDSGYDYIHNSEDFIKNIEITILSYLLVGATFPQTGLGGGLNFDKIIKENSFKGRLNLFLELYLVNEEKIITETIKNTVGIDVEKHEELVEMIRNHEISRVAGVDLGPIKSRMISDIEGFAAIFQFYTKIKKISKNKKVTFNGESLFYDIKKNEVKILFDELMYSYKYVLKSFPQSPVSKSLLDFMPNKKLSTGEKAILDFYSSMYTYIDTNKESKHLSYEHFLLLLDEPDLGFHPVWKKKFIEAISSTLPILFSKMTPHIYDGNKNYVKVRENPMIQIIFTTHDPLTLSDILNDSVVYLKKEGGLSKVLTSDDINRPQKTFGANIHELLSDSFFVEDGLIGEFASTKIDQAIDWLNNQADKKKFEYYRTLIENIGEPLIKNKLAEMYSEKMKDDLAKKVLKEEIDRLTDKYNNI
ncbi:AAA family ATPase [Chryseobacterium kwangjuense]|uniref:AAA family ATPase n=1 Tax=Chryseobacterium kwangjuense TaxID=267125 RepID=A0ABW9JXA7_9FLAO